MGATTPAVSYVDKRPTKNVVKENPITVITIDLFLPNLSAQIPKITKSRDRILNVTVYDANVAIMLNMGSLEGKNNWLAEQQETLKQCRSPQWSIQEMI